MQMRKLFRPGQGQRPAKYCAWFINGTASYRGDSVILDATAPTSQGSSGVLEGKTLGAADFVFVTPSAATTTSDWGLQAGVIEGPCVGHKDTVTAMTNDTVVVVQTWGIHDKVQVSSTDTAASSKLYISDGTAAGAGVAIYAAATATLGTDGYPASPLMGISMTTDATYTRGTVATAKYAVAFVRCDF